MKNSPPDQHPVLLAFGSNLGDRQKQIETALKALETHPEISVQALSPWYETEPIGYTEQGPFLNGVALLHASLSPLALLSVLQNIEHQLGKSTPFLNGPRTIDLDIIWYADFTRQYPQLALPHPRWAERLFVVRPLADLLVACPEEAVPSTWRTAVAQAREQLDSREWEKMRPWR